MTSKVPLIDQQRCIGCGACRSICPDRIIGAGSSDKAFIDGESCMQCGHCYAVCPAEAVSVPFLSSAPELTSMDSGGATSWVDPLPSQMLMEIMKQRRSCRLYKDKPVDRALIDDLLQAAVTAPSGTNSQGWKFLVLPNREGVIRLGEVTADFYRRLNRKAAKPMMRSVLKLLGYPALHNYYEGYYQKVQEALKGWDKSREDRLFHGAPAAIIVAADRRSSCPAEDALLASQNILLMAEALDLGSCLIGYVVEAARRDPSINRLLDLDKNYRIHSVVALGYPAVNWMRPVGRKAVKPEILASI
ncbi:MAG: 4Fe-4S binding protein [Desulfofustis sp.]|nr:nitroreductase family protein [Desulfofustis sp.]NNK14058.1 4Fe-4S binding protein [Desulfofustis sp.]RZW22866.1 MAG: 4Fe-4S dicluster domain-containing protein [Desulfobulbaceae bacterium]